MQNTTISLWLTPKDDIEAGVDQHGYVVLRVNINELAFMWSTDTEAACTEAVGTIDTLVDALQTMRRELLRRAVNAGLDSRDPRYVPAADEIVAFDPDPTGVLTGGTSPRRAPHHDFAQRKPSFSLDQPGPRAKAPRSSLGEAYRADNPAISPLERRAIDGDR